MRPQAFQCYDNVFLAPENPPPLREPQEDEKQQALAQLFSDPTEFMEQFLHINYKRDLTPMDSFLKAAFYMVYQRDYSEVAVQNLLNQLQALEYLIDDSVDALLEKELTLLPF